MINSSYIQLLSCQRNLEATQLSSLSALPLPVTLGGSLSSFWSTPGSVNAHPIPPRDQRADGEEGAAWAKAEVRKEGGCGLGSWLSDSKYLWSSSLCQAQCWVWQDKEAPGPGL